MNDSASVSSASSSLSASLSKMECPYCNKDLQVRSMFNHIRLSHSREFLHQTNKKWIDEAEQGQALKMWWTTKNDFDEDVDKVIYACLSTNKTFLTEARAIQHFKKDKAALKDHNKQLKAFRKEFERKQQEERKPSSFAVQYQQALEKNDPQLVQELWNAIILYRSICKDAMRLCEVRKFNEQTIMYQKQDKSFVEISYPLFRDNYANILLQKVDDLITTKCVNAKVLDQINKQLFKLWNVDLAESIPWTDYGLIGRLGRESYPALLKNGKFVPWGGGEHSTVF